jgi:hypothetical protein
MPFETTLGGMAEWIGIGLDVQFALDFNLLRCLRATYTLEREAKELTEHVTKILMNYVASMIVEPLCVGSLGMQSSCA